MSSYILYECNNLKDVWFLGWEGFYQNTIDYGWLSGLPTTTTIHAFPETIHEIKSYYDYQRYNWKCDTIELVEIKDSTLATLSFRIKDPLIDGKKFVLDNIIMNGRLFSYNQNITHDGTGLYTIDLVPNEIVKATINFTLDGDEYSCTLGLRSKYAEILSQLISYKQTQMECTVTADEDQTANADEVGIYLNSYYPADKSGKVHITGLTPGKTYYYAPYAKYKGYYVEGTSTKITTNGTNPELTCVPGVTSIICTGNKTIDDATLKEQWVECNGEKLSGQDIILTGLEPEQKYTVTYTVTTEEGSTEKVEKTVKTTALELTMLNPQPVSSTCAIVAAETNISDVEPNVGFQWRKYEAPETLPSSEGYAAIYDGRIEGYIKRLQSASFYNARAFYKSNSGTYYYSDWVTFDPSDFSYFEPTVHTYAVETVTESTASVRGYVLAGTDEITQQGFEYWPEGGTESAAKQMAVAIASNATDDGVSVVFGTGQVMTATLDGLSPATTYRIRAFVTTAQGTTYGEEQTFTTAKPTGIAAAEEQAEAPAIVGYYDLSGRPLESPQKGITIVRYSDGTCKKICNR